MAGTILVSTFYYSLLFGKLKMKNEKTEVPSELVVKASPELEKAVAAELKAAAGVTKQDEEKNKEAFNKLLDGANENS